MQFSVVIPSFNVERYIEDCVTSALQQTFEGEHEVIVVDDGSTDTTREILTALAAKHDRLRVYMQSNDGAPGKARNRGIEAATGSYLVFLDSDDRLPAKALSIFAAAIQQHDADVICGAGTLINDHAELIGRRSLPDHLLKLHQLDGCFRLGLRRVLVNASAKAFRRSLISRENLRFPEGHPGQDSAFTVTFCAFAQTVHGLEDIVYEVRVRGDDNNPSLTQQFDTRAVQRRLISAQQCVHELRSRGRHDYATNTHAYFLLGILSRIIREYRRGRVNDLQGTYDVLVAYQKHAVEHGATGRTSREIRWRWCLARIVLSSRWMLRLSLAASRLMPGRKPKHS